MHSDIVVALVQEYRARYNLNPIEVSDLLTRPGIWQDNRLEEGPGCYALYDTNKMLRYIGASDTIKRRSNNHFSVRTQASQFWVERKAHFTQLIRTQEIWEPWSLEKFLTKRTDDLRKHVAQ